MALTTPRKNQIRFEYENLVSHSARDVILATSLTKLLRAATPLSPEDIRCTSVDGYRLPGGAYSSEFLRREVHDCEVLIGLITPTSVSSGYVLSELGARWGLNQPLIPLLAKGATPDLLPGPLVELNALDLASPSQIHQMLEDISRQLVLNLFMPSVYEVELTELSVLAQEPVTTPLMTTAENSKVSRPQRLRAAFIAGTGLGARIMLLPATPTDTKMLVEFIIACRLLGTSENKLSYFETYSKAPFDLEKKDPKGPDPKIIADFFDKISSIENEIPSFMSATELGWFKLAYQLSQVQTLSYVYSTEDPVFRKEGHSIDGPLLTLRSTIDVLDAPTSVIEALSQLVERAQNEENALFLFREFQSVAQTIYSLLDVVILQPNQFEE